MIDKEKKYSISEVSKMTGYEPHVLRYYENDFNLDIPRTESNRRYYTSKEIEKIIYIKQLQEKGLSNNQIKLVLKAPEVLIDDSKNEIAITEMEVGEFSQNPIIDNRNNNYNEVISNFYNLIHNEIKTGFNEKLDETKNEIIQHIDHALDDNYIKDDDDSPSKKEKDILICENARLKMKLKEKSYELAELKEKLKRIDNKELSFWKRIFS